jgi:hypothetical protein
MIATNAKVAPPRLETGSQTPPSGTSQSHHTVQRQWAPPLRLPCNARGLSLKLGYLSMLANAGPCLGHIRHSLLLRVQRQTQQ